MAVQQYNQSAKPPVLAWYMVYCVLLAVICLLAVGVGVFWMAAPEFMKMVMEANRANQTNEDIVAIKIVSAMYIIVGLPLMILYIVALFLPRKPWAWTYGIITIAISFLGCCCIPAGIPLLIYWLKPDVKRYFGMADDSQIPQPPPPPYDSVRLCEAQEPPQPEIEMESELEVQSEEEPLESADDKEE